MRNQTKTNTRRNFIRQSAITAAMLPFLFSCGQSNGVSNAVFDEEAIKKFRKHFKGKIFLPGDALYDIKRQAGFVNPEIDRFPTIIAACNDENDVLIALEFALTYQLEIAVRSGNHSNMGWGTVEKGMVIDVSQLKHISINAAKKTCLVAAGATAAEILSASAAFGLAPVLGECGTVGSGLVLGGGLGWLSGKYGATCDNLLKAHIVAPDLNLYKADAATNQELFWATKGGGGNFGIATSFEYQLHPITEILGGSMSYPLNQARSLLKFYNEFMASAPDDLQADFYLTSKGCWVEFVYSGNLGEGEVLLNQFRKFGKPEKDAVKRRPFSEVYSMEPGGTLSSDIFMANKGIYIEHLSEDVIDLVLECLSQSPPACEVYFDFSHFMHGEVCRVPTGATAFELRQPNAVHLAFWIIWHDSADSASCNEWVNDKFRKLMAFSGGRIYANYMSVPGGTNAASVFGSNLQRLKQVKKKFDPGNVFHLNQNILPG